MSSKRVRLISLTGIILIALIISVSVLMNLLSRETQETPLPATSASADVTDGIGVSDNNGLNHVKITIDNVQAVVDIMSRPLSYTRNIKIVDDYSSYDIMAAVDGTNTALKVTYGKTTKHIIVAGDKLFIWYDGDETPYERPIVTAEDEKRSSDEYQMILSYEDVVRLDKSSITAADYKEYNGENCIYVQYVTERLHYRTECYISVKTGLLIGAQHFDGNALIYTMTSSGFNPEVPDLSVYDLPDGKSAVSAP